MLKFNLFKRLFHVTLLFFGFFGKNRTENRFFTIISLMNNYEQLCLCCGGLFEDSSKTDSSGPGAWGWTRKQEQKPTDLSGEWKKKETLPIYRGKIYVQKLTYQH